jgi:hypothetical protein
MPTAIFVPPMSTAPIMGFARASVVLKSWLEF